MRAPAAERSARCEAPRAPPPPSRCPFTTPFTPPPPPCPRSNLSALFSLQNVTPIHVAPAVWLGLHWRGLRGEAVAAGMISGARGRLYVCGGGGGGERLWPPQAARVMTPKVAGLSDML